MTTTLVPNLHPNEEGPRFLFGKVYFWDRQAGGPLTLKPWPNNADGSPAKDPRNPDV